MERSGRGAARGWREGPRRHPLHGLEGAAVGCGRLRLARLERTARSGWMRFELEIRGGAERPAPSVVKGIHSAGGRGVRPWIEVDRYRPQGVRDSASDRAAEAAERDLFARLVALIPPGGHLMLECEGRDHARTHRSLMRRAPPAATRLGALLVRCGLPRVRFFALPEGGREGGQKLWAERPPDDATHRAWWRATAAELRAFRERRAGDPALRDDLARADALLREGPGA